MTRSSLGVSSEAYEDQGKAVRTELHSDVVAWSVEWYLIQ